MEAALSLVGKKKPQRTLQLSKSHTRASAMLCEIILRSVTNVDTTPYMLLVYLAYHPCYHEVAEQ
jgi:hypothetical protein